MVRVAPGASTISLVERAVQSQEALVAVGHERAHAECCNQGVRLLQATRQHQRLPQDETTACLDDSSFHRRRLFHCPREQWYGIVNAPGQAVCRS